MQKTLDPPGIRKDVNERVNVMGYLSLALSNIVVRKEEVNKSGAFQRRQARRRKQSRKP